MLYTFKRFQKYILYIGLFIPILGLGLRLEARFMSLEEALHTVEQENLTVLLNKESVQQALQGHYMKRAGLFPQVKVEVSQARQKDSFKGADSSTYNTMQAAITGSINVFDYSVYQAYQAAKQGHKVSQQAYKAILESVLYETAKAYYAYARDLQRLEVLNKNLERDTGLLDLAEGQLLAGIASPLDRMRAYTIVLQDKQALLQQSITLKKRDLQLKQFLNLDPLEELTIDKSILEADMPACLLASLDDICLRRPDYRQGLKKIKQLKAEVQQAKGGHFPTATVFASSGISGTKLFNKGERSTWMVGAKVSLPLFEGFRVSSDLLRAQAALRQQRYALAELKNTIKSAYLLAKASLEALQEQVVLSKDQVHLALEELEMAKDRFKQGVADNQALLSAQASLALVEDQDLSLLYAYALASLDLAFEQGRVRLILNSHPL